MDERGFRALYSEHAGAVFTFARRRLGASEAEDLVADVFLVAWRRRSEVPADPLPWLLGVARWVLANRRRGLQRAAALVDRLTQEALASGAPEAVDDLDPGVLRALGTLGEADQELLLLVAWEGLSRDQLAAVFGVSTGAIAVRLFRARRRLARALADQPGSGSARSGSSSSMEEVR